MDAMLYQIYRSETEEHVKVIEKFLDEASRLHKFSNVQVSNDLKKTFHTLHGSSKSAGVMPVANLAGLFEQYLTYLQVHNQPIPKAAFTWLRNATEIFYGILDNIDNQEENMILGYNELHSTLSTAVADLLTNVQIEKKKSP
jgi:chemosensory pili system protein ChpA (sensor histidine kinase/response regulator)